MEIRNSDFSTLPHEFSRSSHRSNTSYLVDQSADKSAYKKDKACAVCNTNFSILGLTQKHHCNFCYRGVCWKCSLQQAYHPDMHEMTRICDQCYNKSIQTKISKEFESSLGDVKNEIKELKEKLQSEQRTSRSEKIVKTQIKGELTKIVEKNKETENELSKKIEESEKANEEIENENQKLNEEIDEILKNEENIDGELKSIQSQIEEGLQDLKNYQLKIEEIKNLNSKEINNNQKKNSAIKKAEKIQEKLDGEKLQREKEETDKNQRIERSKKEIDEVKRMNTRLIHKIQELQENEDTEEEIRKSLETPNRLSERLSITPRMGDPYKLLRDQLKSQIEEISKLQLEIKNSKNESTFTLNKESMRDPFERDQCKCVLQ
ncbi:unnamed protein product [Blepharisma stoltei]|uniref:FYVE-type domain-containing protein n=1 Tax=Blepharisma stoltei TaxID=1481888 RepID=A0AAU9JPK4_9CILI|nr:unnamed protein product [Blepharisma stoltei]